MRKQETVSVFRKVFILFFVTILFIYIVAAGAFIQYLNQQKKNDEATQKSRASNFITGMRQQIQEMYNMETSLMNDSRVSQLAYNSYTDKYEQSQLIAGLIGDLKNTESMNSFIEDIILLFPESGIELSAKNKYNKKIFDSNNSFIVNQRNSILIWNEGKLEMNISYPLTFWMEENYIPDYTVSVIISEPYYNNYLQTFRIEDKEGAFLVINDNGVYKLFASSNEIDKELLQHLVKGDYNIKQSASNTTQINYNGTQYIIVTESIPIYEITFVTYQSTKVMNQNTLVTLLVLSGFILISAGLFGLVIISTRSSVSKPLRKVMDAFAEVKKGNFNIRIYHKPNDEFQYIYTSFNDTVSYIEGLIDNIKEQGNLLQNAELMQLQSQINPHFLYNSFYMIKFMAKSESYDQIIELVTALAKYYRFINKEVNQSIPLINEVEHMECYVDIQQMRFGDKISIEKEKLPTEVENFMVPKLILQPIIENAYNYGIADMLDNGMIWIRYRMENTTLKIEIEDNGGAVDEEVIEKLRKQIKDYKGPAIGHALTNIQRRLELAYGNQNGLMLDIGEYKGLKVTVLLDILHFLT